MPGLVPGIYVFTSFNDEQDVDGRDKPGHDDGEDVCGAELLLRCFLV